MNEDKVLGAVVLGLALEFGCFLVGLISMNFFNDAYYIGTIAGWGLCVCGVFIAGSMILLGVMLVVSLLRE